MKAKIISTKCEGKNLTFVYTIKFKDPYCNNVIRVAKGVARCNPDDKFDAIVGSRIAESRAKIAMFQKLYNSAGNLKDNLKSEMWIQYNRSKRETEHINKLLKNYYDEQQDNKKA